MGKDTLPATEIQDTVQQLISCHVTELLGFLFTYPSNANIYDKPN